MGLGNYSNGHFASILYQCPIIHSLWYMQSECYATHMFDGFISIFISLIYGDGHIKLAALENKHYFFYIFW